MKLQCWARNSPLTDGRVTCDDRLADRSAAECPLGTWRSGAARSPRRDNQQASGLLLWTATSRVRTLEIGLALGEEVLDEPDFEAREGMQKRRVSTAARVAAGFADRWKVCRERYRRSDLERARNAAAASTRPDDGTDRPFTQRLTVDRP